jgi:hypothetical protein
VKLTDLAGGHHDYFALIFYSPAGTPLLQTTDTHVKCKGDSEGNLPHCFYDYEGSYCHVYVSNTVMVGIALFCPIFAIKGKIRCDPRKFMPEQFILG